MDDFKQNKQLGCKVCGDIKNIKPEAASGMHLIWPDMCERESRGIDTLASLMFIAICGPPIELFKPDSYT